MWVRVKQTGGTVGSITRLAIVKGGGLGWGMMRQAVYALGRGSK